MSTRVEQFGANWDELGADGRATTEELTARVMELATGARTAVVTIAGLLGGARSNGVYENRLAREFLDAINKATEALASLLPENRPVAHVDPIAPDMTGKEG